MAVWIRGETAEVRDLHFTFPTTSTQPLHSPPHTLPQRLQPLNARHNRPTAAAIQRAPSMSSKCVPALIPVKSLDASALII